MACRFRNTLLLVLTVSLLMQESNGFLVGSRVRGIAPVVSVQQPPRCSPLSYRNRHDEAETAVAAVGVVDTKSHHAPPAPTMVNPSSEKTSRTGVPLTSVIVVSQLLTLVVASVITFVGLFLTQNSFDFNALHWNADQAGFSSLFDWSLTPLRVVEGILTAIPMIYLGTLVDNSDGRDESHASFSTNHIVMTLFGRRNKLFSSNNEPHPEIHSQTIMHVLPMVALLTLVTGFIEEIVFRGELPSLLYLLSNHSTFPALIGQATIFGLSHCSKRASAGENRVVCMLHTLNGLWYGIVYLLAGGDILPCIIGHVLYDAHVFVQTWIKVNNQMDYTEAALQSGGTTTSRDEIEDSLQDFFGPKMTLDENTFEFMKRFYFNFDHEHKGTLSRFDVRRAVNYAFMNSTNQPSRERMDNLMDSLGVQERLTLEDFLKVLFVLRRNQLSNSGTVNNSNRMVQGRQ